jgi:conjugal transfer pilus assembly protein TraF
MIRLLIALMFSSSVMATYNMKDPEGFLWYKDTLEQTQPLKKSKKDSKELTPEQKAVERNKSLSEKLDIAIHVALDTPTLENVIAAQKLQQQVINKSEKFSKAWVIASMLNPQNQDPGSNPNSVHQQLLKFEKAKKMKEIFKTLSEDYGLFYVWQPGCPYCDRFLPMVRDFSKKYGFDVLAISKQGGQVQGLKSIPDNGFIDRYNVQGTYPALFLVHYKSKQVLPLAWGMTAVTEMEETLWRLIQYISEGEKKQ